MITAETITDDQIRELLDAPGLSLADRAWCLVAHRIPVGRRAEERRAEARARCAEILNARGAK